MHILAATAVAAVAFSGAALAEDASTGPTAMTDAELDAVTAGVGLDILNHPEGGVVLGGANEQGRPLGLPEAGFRGRAGQAATVANGG